MLRRKYCAVLFRTMTEKYNIGRPCDVQKQDVSGFILKKRAKHVSLSGTRHSQSSASEGTEHSASLLSASLLKTHLGSAVHLLAQMLKFDSWVLFSQWGQSYGPWFGLSNSGLPGSSLLRSIKDIVTQWLPAQFQLSLQVENFKAWEQCLAGG